MNNIDCISSKDNKYIKEICKLQKSAKERKEKNRFVLEGLRICKDAAQNGIHFVLLLYTEGFYNKFNDDLKYFINNSEMSYSVKDDVFDKISETKSPQGIIGVAEMPELYEKISDKKRYIALDNINDPSNLGAISRTAEALGISGIIITSDSCDPYSPKSIRASMGTLLRMPIYITEDLPLFFKNNNLKSYACVVDESAKSICDIKFSDGDVIIIGNEANGISDYVKSKSNRLVTIPMKGKAESLNAAAAAAIALYELSK